LGRACGCGAAMTVVAAARRRESVNFMSISGDGTGSDWIYEI
jgi:hypothetical protein